MEEIKDEIIVIDSKDYKDKDKIITFYSLHNGLGQAKVRGAKGQNAKLKMLGNVFCYSEVIFFKSSEMLLVKTANINETFFGLAADMDKFSAASSCIEVLKNSVYYEQCSPMIFLLTLKSLFELCYGENLCPAVVLSKYIIEILKLTGYNTNFESCSKCDTNLHKAFLDLESGDIVCEKCKTAGFTISPKSVELLNSISNTKIAKLSSLNINESESKTINAVLKKLLTIKLNKELKSF